MDTISLICAQDAPEALWQAAADLQARCPDRADPLFSPHLARLLAPLRSDTHLICAHDENRLIAFWPLHVRPGGWARPLAGPFSDWHAPLIDPEHVQDPASLLRRAGLRGITVTAYKPAAGEPLRAGERVGAHITELGGDYAAWYEHQRSLFPRHFKKMRQKRRHLERDFGKVEYSLDDRSEETFETILQLKRAQYAATGRHDVLAAPWAQSFVRALRDNGIPSLHLRTVSLYLDGRFAAGEIMICSQTVVHGWLTAYDQDFATYSPGFLVVEAILEDMLHRGQHIYDSGPGQDYYKKYYTNHMVPVDQGVLRAGGPASMAPARLLSRGWRGLEHTLPVRASTLMGKIRRRADQILVSELHPADRVRGFARAISQGSGH